MALPRRRAGQGDEGPAPGASPPEADWRAHYEIENPDAVEAYVARHPTVQPVLGEAAHQIHAVFGNDAPPRLRLTWDPEDGDCWLFVGIPSEDVGPAILPLIEALDKRWWLDRMTTTDAVLTFDVVPR